MQIINSPAAMQRQCFAWRCAGQSVALVPTMGALHDGHLELCRRARAENDRLVASIFVNPTQFGSQEDLSQYPRPFERDADLLRELGCDALFAPDAATMYGEGEDACWVEVTPLGETWEGAMRPGHLRGVATVVAKLFNIAGADRAYFGEKDFQQLRVIQIMARDLFFATQIVPVPTLREPDGLAMSSRNAYLSPAQRAAAPTLYRALQSGAQLAARGERAAATIRRAVAENLAAQPLFEPQYLAIVDAQSLQPLETLGDQSARILAAAWLGQTRLIDNIALHSEASDADISPVGG